MNGNRRAPTGRRRSVWGRVAIAAAVAACLVRPAAAGTITGVSWDGSPPGTLADISGQSSFSFGLPAFDAGVYEVTWLGGLTAWRDETTIGAAGQTLFDPGAIARGTTETLATTSPWSLWATTPDLAFAESTGAQWAFASLGPDSWLWGLEDITLGRADADYQDAYGTITRLGDVVSQAILPPVLELPPPPTVVDDQALVPVPEAGTFVLVGIGLLAVVAGRRRSL
jgi:hypothetical protein